MSQIRPLPPLLSELACFNLLFILQLSRNCARDMEFGSFENREDGEYSGVGVVETSNVFVMHVDFISLEQNHFAELMFTQ